MSVAETAPAVTAGRRASASALELPEPSSTGASHSASVTLAVSSEATRRARIMDSTRYLLGEVSDVRPEVNGLREAARQLELLALVPTTPIPPRVARAFVRSGFEETLDLIADLHAAEEAIVARSAEPDSLAASGGAGGATATAAPTLLSSSSSSSSSSPTSSSSSSSSSSFSSSLPAAALGGSGAPAASVNRPVWDRLEFDAAVHRLVHHLCEAPGAVDLLRACQPALRAKAVEDGVSLDPTLATPLELISDAVAGLATVAEGRMKTVPEPHGAERRLLIYRASEQVKAVTKKMLVVERELKRQEKERRLYNEAMDEGVAKYQADLSAHTALDEQLFKTIAADEVALSKSTEAAHSHAVAAVTQSLSKGRDDLAVAVGADVEGEAKERLKVTRATKEVEGALEKYDEASFALDRQIDAERSAIAVLQTQIEAIKEYLTTLDESRRIAREDDEAYAAKMHRAERLDFLFRSSMARKIQGRWHRYLNTKAAKAELEKLKAKLEKKAATKGK